MKIRDQAFNGALALSEGLEETGLSSGLTATDAGCDWRSRYERERERADAAEARCEVLRREADGLRQALMTSQAEHEKMASRVGTLKARIGELEGENDRIRSSRTGLSKSMFGRKSERQDRKSSGRKRGQQRGAPGHGRTQRPGLEEKKERHDPPEEERICPRCGEPCTANGTEESSILEIEVKAHKRRIVRTRWRRACTCPSLPTEAIAEPVPRLFENTPYGISIWATLLYERYAGLRPLNRVAAWMSDHGLAMSAGTLANGTKRLVPLFEPVANAILAHLNQAPVRGADETGWRIRSLWSQFGSGRAWLWFTRSTDAVFFLIDRSRSAEVAHKLFDGIEHSFDGVETIAALVCDRYPAYPKLARELEGKVILQFCWAHQRRTFLKHATGRPKLTEWCNAWLDRIAKLYRLNRARLVHHDPDAACRTPAFDRANAELKEAVDTLFATAERELDGLPAGTPKAKALRSLLNHRQGLCTFVDRPEAPMDNNWSEERLRKPVIGRRLIFGSDSVEGARFTAMMYTVVGTLTLNGINIRHWLHAWLTACAQKGGKPPDDPGPWLPWSMSEERKQDLMAPG